MKLSRSEESLVKRLADMKAYLERKIAENESELTKLRGFLEVVDEMLAERSFKKVEVPGVKVPTQPIAEPLQAPKVREVSAIATISGDHLADIQVSENELRLVPNPDIKFDSNSPPLRAFLINRVLEPVRVKDQEAAKSGQLPEDRAMTYEVAEESGQFKGLTVRNYGDDRRLLELKNAIRWTLRRMYEKTKTRS